ncbi:MAG: hypothetical protein P9X24_06580 [Candidatus Hatepunaea meridiana]|nr:hypothetical protein [Candidatus Hatepunaea meridiana]
MPIKAQTSIILRLLIISILILTPLFFNGCGGNQLIPRDLKDYVSAKLGTPRRNVDLTQIFTTTIILRLEQTDIFGALQAEKDLIGKCVEYFQRDNITDYIQDTLVFHVRLNADADTYMKWKISSKEVIDLVKGRMTEDEFFDICAKEENW